MFRKLLLTFSFCLLLANALSQENSTSEIAEEPLKNIDANLTLIGINDLLIVRNRDKKVVFILDILFNIVILIEGDTKTVIVINLSLRSGFLVINKGLLNLEWVGLSSVNPTVVVSSIKSITLLKSGIKRFGLDSVNEEIINVLFNFAKILEPLVKEDLELDKELSVELIVSVFERILIYSTSTLKGLPKIIGVKEIHLPTGIPALANNIEGLAKLLELVAPLDELPDIGLNAEIIFGAENGLVTITHILERVIKHSDIVPIDGLRALTPASVTEISSLLGGQIVVESSGITRILSVIFQYRQGLVNESVVFNNFILYASYSMNQSNIKQEFNQDVTDFKNILVNYKEDIFADLIEYSENMNYTFKDIKIHSICQTLVNAITKDNVFEVILKALLNLEPAINHNRIVQTLLMTLIGKFFKPSGRYQLNNLDINVDKKIPVLTAEDNTLLKSEGNIYQILNDLSITKQIIKKVEKALETVSPDLDLEYVLTANSNPYIYGVLQYIFNIDLGVSDADMSFASSFVKSINNFFNFLEVDANDYYH